MGQKFHKVTRSAGSKGGWGTDTGARFVRTGTRQDEERVAWLRVPSFEQWSRCRLCRLVWYMRQELIEFASMRTVLVEN